MDYMNKIVGDIEIHSADGIRECFSNGINPNDFFRNEPLIYELTSEYLRSPRFKDCVRAFVDFGFRFDDKILLSVLLDDDQSLESQVKETPAVIDKRYTLRCAFTPLYEVTLLHICAEFNHVSCAEILVKNGADIDAKAGFDENGFGGQTPIFHTVNQRANACIDVMKFLISQGADLTLTVPGLIWGKGYEWETFIPSVNPLSYAMMGLLRQFNRTEPLIYEVVSILLKAKYATDYFPTNIPNKYLYK
jgi:Ankyrin repeat